MIQHSRERYRVVVTGQHRSSLYFRTLAACKGFMDYAIVSGGARRVRLYEDGRLVEDRRTA